MTRLPALLASRRAATAAPDARLDLSALLDAVEAAPPAEGVDALAAELAARVSASEVSMLIADISGRTLARLARRPVPGRGLPLRPARAHVEIDGTPAGTALTTHSGSTQLRRGRCGCTSPSASAAKQSASWNCCFPKSPMLRC